MRFARMTATVISGADFTNADLRDANLRSLYEADRATFDGVKLQDTHVTGELRSRRSNTRPPF